MRFIEKVRKIGDLEEKCAFARCRDYIMHRIEESAKVGRRSFAVVKKTNQYKQSPINNILVPNLKRIVQFFRDEEFEVREKPLGLEISW